MPAQLAPEAASAISAAAQRARPSVHLMPVPDARRTFEQESRATNEAADMLPPATGERIIDITTQAGVAARLYRPNGGLLPVVVFFHGGGWVLGSIETHNLMCRVLARESGCAVLSVDYRLAPEHPFPTAIDDAENAWKWVTEHGPSHDLDPSRLAVAGDSAGGNIAIALALRTATAAIRPSLQLLFYPVTTTDLTIGLDPSYDGLVLCRDELLWHQSLYLPHVADRRAPLASPLDRADLRGVPPALVIAAECDPIAPQSRLYVEALHGVEVPAELHVYPGMIHGFAQFPTQFQAARDALAAAAAALSTALRPRAPVSGATVH